MDMESPKFYLGRYEVILEQIRDALEENATQSNRVADAMERIAEHLEEGAIHVKEIKGRDS